ncbi:MAG: glycosyltransferase family 39 protein [Acidobacteriales bacterium]|nr:glycosyltransferase family 39 protein [Terriglobales bacterium]
MRRSVAYILLLLAIFSALVASHAPLVKLPYFWDEAGYYIPAAHDLYTHGQLIPSSTLSNAHPPLVMAYLALAWKLFGYSPAVTRIAILLIAAFGLMGLYLLAKTVSNREVAAATVGCTAVYPVFFAQSSLAHLDLAAAALSFWALDSHFRNRLPAAAAWFALAALTKETAIVTPLALIAWELLAPRFVKAAEPAQGTPSKWQRVAWLLLPVLPLAAWFTYHYLRTGYVFGNPEFVRYNLSETLNPVRVLFALVRRLWQTFGHMNLYVLTLAAALAMLFPPVRNARGERRRISVPIQLTLATVVLTHILFFSLVGGAALTRYLITVIPLVILIGVSTLWRRVKGWQLVIGLICIAFAAGLFINPPYVFAPEDNLSYRDFVSLHQEGADFLEREKFGRRVLTPWPGSDELSKPYLGYVQDPFTVLKLEGFSAEQLQAAAQNASFDSAFVFSTKYDPPRRLWQPKFWEDVQRKFFGYHRDLRPEAAAGILGGEIVFAKHRGGHWVAVIRVQRVENAFEQRATSDKQ